MHDVVASVAGLPAFLLYFGISLALVAVFLAVYTFITPYDEISLIRQGNTAAGIGLSGALIGFVLPLASAITHSVNWLDMLVWGAIALVVQILVYFLMSRLMPHLPEAINEGRNAHATVLASASIALGIVNAACMTY
jgi:putative membrane protein